MKLLQTTGMNRRQPLLSIDDCSLASPKNGALAFCPGANYRWARGFSARKIFIMLFLMLGPLNILVPFITLTGNSVRVLRRRLATRAIVFSMAALALAGLFGRNILDIS